MATKGPPRSLRLTGLNVTPTTPTDIHALAMQINKEACAEQSQGKWELYCALARVDSYLKYGFNTPRGRDWPVSPGRPPWVETYG